MRTVYISLSLSHHYTGFVRTVNVFRPQYKLPACGNTACRSKYVIIPIAFIKFCPFYSMVHTVITIEYHYRIGYNGCTFVIHLTYSDYTVESGSAACPCVRKIYIAVTIPKWTRVYHTLSSLYKHRLFPLTVNIFCLDHEDTEIRIAPINIKLTLVMTD